jgi:hypothetical protein
MAKSKVKGVDDVQVQNTKEYRDRQLNTLKDLNPPSSSGGENPLLELVAEKKNKQKQDNENPLLDLVKKKSGGTQGSGGGLNQNIPLVSLDRPQDGDGQSQSQSSEPIEPPLTFEKNKQKSIKLVNDNVQSVYSYFKDKGTFDKDLQPFMQGVRAGDPNALKKAHEIIDLELSNRITQLQTPEYVIGGMPMTGGGFMGGEITYIPQELTKNNAAEAEKLKKQKKEIDQALFMYASGSIRDSEGKLLPANVVGARTDSAGFNVSDDQKYKEAKATLSKTHFKNVAQQHKDYRVESNGYEAIFYNLNAEYYEAQQAYQKDNSQTSKAKMEKIKGEYDKAYSEYNSLDLKYPEIAKKNLASMLSDNISAKKATLNPLELFSSSVNDLKGAWDDIKKEHPEFAKKYSNVYASLLQDDVNSQKFHLGGAGVYYKPIAQGGFTGGLNKGLDELEFSFLHPMNIGTKDEDRFARELGEQSIPQATSFSSDADEGRIVIGLDGKTMIRAKNDLSNGWDNVVYAFSKQVPAIAAFTSVEGIATETVGALAAVGARAVGGVTGEFIEGVAGIKNGTARMTTNNAFKFADAASTAGKLKHFTGLQVAQFATSYGANYDASVSKFKDDSDGRQKAQMSAILKTAAEATVFQVAGWSPTKILGGAIDNSIKKDIDKLLAETDFSKMGKTDIASKFADIVAPKIEKLVPSTVKESLKMAGISTVNEYLKGKIDEVLSGKEAPKGTDEDKVNKTIEIAKSGAMMGFAMAAFGGLVGIATDKNKKYEGKYAPSHLETLMHLSQTPEESKWRAQQLFENGSITADRRNELIKVINTTSNSLNDAANLARANNKNFSRLKSSKQQELLASQFKQRYLKDLADKNPDLKEENLRQIEQLRKDDLDLFDDETSYVKLHNITDNFVKSLGITYKYEVKDKEGNLSEVDLPVSTRGEIEDNLDKDFYIKGEDGKLQKLGLEDLESHINNEAIKLIDAPRITATEQEILKGYEKRLSDGEELPKEAQKEYEKLSKKKELYDKQQKYFKSVEDEKNKSTEAKTAKSEEPQSEDTQDEETENDHFKGLSHVQSAAELLRLGVIDKIGLNGLVEGINKGNKASIDAIKNLKREYNNKQAANEGKRFENEPPLSQVVTPTLEPIKKVEQTPTSEVDVAKEDDGVKLNTLNPTGSVFSDYTAAEIDKLPLGDNIVTYDKTAELKPDEKVIVYRGVPNEVGEIKSGDFVTTNKQLAQDYAGDGKVISKEVRADEILDDKTEPLGEEYILREQPLKETTKAETPTTNDALKDVESTAKALKDIKLPNIFKSLDNGGIFTYGNFYRVAQEKFLEEKGLSFNDVFNKETQLDKFKTQKGRDEFQAEFEKWANNEDNIKKVLPYAYDDIKNGKYKYNKDEQLQLSKAVEELIGNKTPTEDTTKIGRDKQNVTDENKGKENIQEGDEGQTIEENAKEGNDGKKGDVVSQVPPQSDGGGTTNVPPTSKENTVDENRAGWQGIQKSMLSQVAMNVMGTLNTVTNRATIDNAIEMLSGIANRIGGGVIDASKYYVDQWHDQFFEKKEGVMLYDSNGMPKIKPNRPAPTTETLAVMGIRQAYLSDMVAKTDDLPQQAALLLEMRKVDEILRVSQNELGRSFQFLQSLFKLGDTGEVMYRRNLLSKIVGEDMPETKEDLDKRVKEIIEEGEVGGTKRTKKEAQEKADRLKEAHQTIEDLKNDLKKAENTAKENADRISKEAFDEAIAEAEKRGREQAETESKEQPKKKSQKSAKLTDKNGKIIKEKANDLAERLFKLADNVEGKGELSADPLLLRNATGAAIRLIAESVKLGGNIADIIEDVIIKIRENSLYKDVDEKELRDRLKSELFSDEAGLGKEVVLAKTTSERISDIASAAKEEGATSITQKMVEDGLIDNLVHSYLGKGLSGDEILEAATKDLKETFPNIDQRQLLDAYLKKGDYHPKTREEANKEIAEQKRDLRTIANLQLENDMIEKGEKILKNKSKKEEISNSVIKQLKAKKELLLQQKRNAEVDQPIKDLDEHLKTWEKISKSATFEGTILKKMKEENRRKIDEALIRNGVMVDRSSSAVRGANETISQLHNDKIDDLIKNGGLGEAEKTMLEGLKIKDYKNIENLKEKISKSIDRIGAKMNVTPIHKDIYKVLSSLKNDLIKGLGKSDEYAKLESSKRKLQGDINKMQRDIAGNRFAALKTPTQLKIDREYINLNHERNKLRAEYDKKEEKFIYQNKKWLGKAFDMYLRFRRGSLISALSSAVFKLPASSLVKIAGDMLATNVAGLSPLTLAISHLSGLENSVSAQSISLKADYEGLKTTIGLNLAGVKVDEAILKNTKTLMAENEKSYKKEKADLLDDNRELSKNKDKASADKIEQNKKKIEHLNGLIEANSNSVRKLKIETLLSSTDKLLKESANNLFEIKSRLEKAGKDYTKDEEYKAAKQSFDDAEVNSSLAFLYQFIGEVWANRGEQIMEGAHGLEEAMGDFKRMTFQDRMDLHSTKFGKQAEAVIYGIDAFGRIHAAVKDVSAVKQFVTEYVKSVEKATRKMDVGQTLKESDKYILMQKAFDHGFKGGKFSEKNATVRVVQDLFKNIDRQIDEKLSKVGGVVTPKRLESEIGSGYLRNILLPVLKIPANIENSGLFKYTLGLFMSLGRIGAEMYKVSKNMDGAAEEEMKSGIQRFGEAFYDHMSNLEPEYADKIKEGLNKGQIGLASMVIAGGMIASGALAFGGVYFPGAKKRHYKDKNGVTRDLPFGAIAVNGEVLDNYTTALINHLDITMPFIMAANYMAAYDQQNKINQSDERRGLAQFTKNEMVVGAVNDLFLALEESPIKNVVGYGGSPESMLDIMDNILGSFFSIGILKSVGKGIDDYNKDERDIRNWRDRAMVNNGLNFLVNKKQKK